MERIDKINKELEEVNRDIGSVRPVPVRHGRDETGRLFAVFAVAMVLIALLFFTYGRISGFAVVNDTMDVSSNLSANVSWNVSSDISGNMSENVSVNVSVNLSVNVSGNITGNITPDILPDMTLGLNMTDGNMTGSENLTLPEGNLTPVDDMLEPEKEELDEVDGKDDAGEWDDKDEEEETARAPATPEVRIKDRFRKEMPVVHRLEDEAGGRFRLEVESRLDSVRNIRLEGLERQDSLDITLEELDQDDGDWEQAYLIDFSKVDFTGGTVRSMARGRSLYKCRTWNFTTQSCDARKVCRSGPDTKDDPACHYEGGWQRLMALTPGEEYEFRVSPEDPVFAEYDSAFTAPYCANGTSPCIANTSLLKCRDSITDGNGPEPNQPNTIDTCSDGTGTYSTPSCGGDESVENITVTDLNHSKFRAGDTVSVSAWVYCYGATDDHLGLVYTNNASASSPSWTLVEFREDACSGAGYQQITFNDFALDDVEGNHSVRVYITYDTAGTLPQNTCAVRSSGTRYDDNDDVVFSVVNTPPTAPTSIECDGGSCNSTFFDDVDINCSGSSDLEGEELTYFISAGYINSSLGSDLESGTRSFSGDVEGLLGETGSINISGFTWKLVELKSEYSTAPVVLATVVTDNNGDDNSLIPTVSMVNTTHFNITLCQDAGAATCDPAFISETLHYFVFDTSATDDYGWIDAGTVTVQPDGGSNNIDWGVTFSNTPYVFSTVNSYSQGGNVSATSWVDSVSATGASKFIGCTHQGTGDSCDSDTPSETFAYVAIDPVAQNISTLDSGSEDISGSAWTGILYSSSYSSPRLMVTQNDDDGGQDPQYPWARSVTSAGADIRYCEQDGAGVCDSHTGELVMWFAVEHGDLRIDGAYDIDADKGWVEYNDTLSSSVNLSRLEIHVTVSDYDDAGSQGNGNEGPDLQLQMYDGSGYVNIGNFSVVLEGEYSLETTDSSVLDAWESPSLSDMRLRAVGMDYTCCAERDVMEWDSVRVETFQSTEEEIGDHTESELFSWNFTGLPEQSGVDLKCRASDLGGTGNYSDYYDPVTNLTIDFSDLEPPGTVIDLESPGQGLTWIYWTWINPLDDDFLSAILYLDGTNVLNTSSSSYNATGLVNSTSYNLTINTKDNSNNVNTSDVTSVVSTMVPDPRPSHSSPVLNSSFGTNTTVENLTCYNQSTFDIDGDDVKNIYDWSLDGSTILLTLAPFEGGSNGSYTREYSGGLGYDLSAYATWNSTGGYDGWGAYSFDGSSEFIDLDQGGSSSVYDSSFTSRTVAMWFRADTVAGTSYRVLYAEGGGTNGMNMYVHDGKVWGGAWSEGSDWQGEWLSFPTTTDTWHFAAIVFDGAENRTSLYYDGSWNTTTSVNATQVAGHGGDDAIGRASGASEAPGSATIPSGSYFDGTIDEFMAFDRALSQEQLGSIYSGSLRTLTFTETSDGDVWFCRITPNDLVYDGIIRSSDLLEIVIDDVAPGSVSSLSSPSQGREWIFWNWTPPGDVDFDQAVIYLNGTNIANTSGSFYNATGLSEDVYYGITVHTKDLSGNVNDTDVSDVNKTLDLTPPGTVFNLYSPSQGGGWIYWDWDNPIEADFDQAIIYINGTNNANTSGSFYNATGLLGETYYEITVNTKDFDGNINDTDVTDINRTLAIADTVPPDVTVLEPSAGDVFNQTALINISAEVTDDTFIYDVSAEVSIPGGGKDYVQLDPGAGDTFSGDFSSTTAVGRYNITIIANDTAGNSNSTETTWFNITVYIPMQDNESNSISGDTTILQDNGDGTYDVEILPQYQQVENVTIFGYNASDPGTLYINNGTADEFVKTYSIDLSDLDFDTADVTVTAQGTYLYKCEDFNFSSQTCDDVFNYTRIRSDLVPGQEYTITLDPLDPGFGETLQGVPYVNDSTMRSQAPDTNYGTFALMRSGRRNSADIYRPIISFNMSSLDLPQGTTIDNAILSLYFFRIPGSDTTGTRTHGVHKVQQSPPRDWNEVQVTANNYTATAAWTSFGGDFNSTPTDTAAFSSAQLGSWLDFNVTVDVQDFFQNQSGNFGWILRDQDESTDNTRRDFRSKEHTDTAQRPRLVVNFSDIQPPSVTSVLPDLAAYQLDDPVQVNATVTDNINVSQVWFNITLPNSSSVLVQGFDDNSDDIYNTTFTQTGDLGTYNMTVFANDTGGNVNYTESSIFYVVGSQQVVFDVYSTNCVGWNSADPCGGDPDEFFDDTGANLTCEFNSSLPGYVTVTWLNLTVVDVIGQVAPATMDAYVNGEYLGAFLDVDDTCSNDGPRNVTGTGSDFNNNGTNYAIVDNTGTTEYVGLGDEDGASTRMMILEVNYSFGVDLPPVIRSFTDFPDPVNQSDNVTITANITDDVAVDSAWVTINSTNYSMSRDDSMVSGQFFDGFESGGFTSNWTVLGNPGTYNRTQVTSSGCGQSANSGTYFALMDSSVDGNYETNVLKSGYDFTGAGDIFLEFYHFDSGEESHQIGDHAGDYVASCTGNSACGDGVFYTCDGSFWYRLEALGTESTWTLHSINISADPDFCSEVNTSFAVKFMQHDNYGCDLDGRGFDDVNITWTEREFPDRQVLHHNTSGESGYVSYTLFANDSIGQVSFKISEYFVLAPDSIPPATVTDLDEQYMGAHWIQWSWTNPSDLDFNHVEVWVNNTFYENISCPQDYYNVTGLLQDTVYEIQTRTADLYGNVNTTWVNDTARTLQANGSVTLDNFEYDQTETVQISGVDWDAGENVTLDIVLPDGTSASGYPKNITADSQTEISDSYDIPYNGTLGIYNVTAFQVSNASKNDLEQFNVTNFTGIPGLQPLRTGVEMYIYLPPLHNLAGARPEDPFLFVTSFNDNTSLYIEDQDLDGDSDDSRGNETDPIYLDEGQSILVYIENGTDTDIDDGDYFRVVADKQIAVWGGSNSPFMAYTVPSESGKLEGEEFYIYGRYDPDFDIPLDMVIFSYENDTNVRVYDVTGSSPDADGTNLSGYTNVTVAGPGNIIDNKVIDEGEHISYINNSLTPGGHTFYIAANKPVAITAGSLREGSDLGGTENFGRDGGYYAVGKDGVTYSKLFYTYVSRGGGSLGEDEMYFFTNTESDVTVETFWADGAANETYTFQLNASNDYFYELIATNSSPYKKVTASEPVAILCGPYLNEGTGDMADFGTSVDGSGVGRRFNVYVPEPGGTGASHAILFAFYNSTYYEIHNGTDKSLLTSGTLDKGENYDFSLGTDARLIINSTENIGVQITNFDDNIGLYAVASPVGVVNVKKYSDVDEVAIGDNVTYFVNIRNPSSVAIYNVSIVDHIYNSVDYVSAVEDPPLSGPVVNFDTPEPGITQIQWNKSSLFPGEKVNITIVSTPTSENETLLLNRVDVNGTSQAGDKIYGEDSTVAFLIDNRSPEIISFIDYPDPQEIDRIVTIEAEITDNVFVSSAIVEINGTNYSMTHGSGDMFYYDFNGTSLGEYVYTIYAADAKGNEATPVDGTFEMKPAADVEPFVQLVSPVDGYTEDNLTTNVTFECNATDNAGLVNISLYITDRFNQSFSFNQTSSLSGLADSASWQLELVNGTYTWNCLAYDDDANPAWNENNYTARIRVPDNIPPSVYGLIPPAVSAFNTTENIELSVNATDLNGVDTVLANISYPNGTTVQVPMFQIGSTEQYNYTFPIPYLEGVYTVTFTANDTRSNLNDTEKTYFEVFNITRQVFGLLTDSNNATLPSTILVYNKTGDLVWADDEEYYFSVGDQRPYNITILPLSGSLNELTYINVSTDTTIINFTRLEDAPETYPSPYESDWTEAIAWWARPDFNFSTARINFSYGAGENLSFWKCPTWDFDAKVCINDTFNTTVNLTDGPGSAVVYVPFNDPVGGAAKKPDYSEAVMLYDVTGLNDTGRRDGGTLVGTYYDQEDINFTVGRSYRIDVFVTNIEPDTRGRLFGTEYTNIDTEWVIDTSGTDAPNITVVNGSITIDPFTVTVTSTGGGQDIGWANGNDPIVLDIDENDTVKYWYVVDIPLNATASSQNGRFRAKARGPDAGIRNTLITTQGSPPSKVNLTFPNNGNNTLIDRTITFIWEPAADPDNHTLTYDINITSELCSDIYGVNISATNFTPLSELGTYDECGTYNWTVRAYDGIYYGLWADSWNFSIQPYVALFFVNNTVDFGSADTDSTNDTTDDDPLPFLIRNDGNVFADIINASANQSFFTSSLTQDSDFQIKVDNTTELFSFNWTGSAADWINLTTVRTIIDYFNWRDTNDTVEVEVKVHVPVDESPGEKITGLVFYGEQS